MPGGEPALQPPTQVPQSRIVDSILESSKKNTEVLGYNDYCDWHDTCNSND